MRALIALFAALFCLAADAGAQVDCRAAPCTLREAADAAGVYVGSAASDGRIASDPDYGPALAREMNSVTHENDLKWAATHPAPGVYTFDAADALIDFAETNGMRVRGHTLIWEQLLIDSTPAYVTDLTDADELRALMTEHIQTVVGRYRGRVETWDVVNEPLETGGSALYENVFFQLLGPGYIAEALRIAHEADPDAHLVINDVLVSSDGPKFEALLQLAADLLAAGAPLHGVGIQGHFFRAPIPEELQANIERLVALGLSVEITELDVLLRGAGGRAERLARQRADYHGVVGACMAVAGCRGVTTWGFTDRYTWIDSFLGPNFDPLLLDESYVAKPAYDGVRDALIARSNVSNLTGNKLALRDKPEKPRKRRLQMVSADPAIDLGAGPGSLDDPIEHGGTLRVLSTAGDGFSATYPLPADQWGLAKRKRPSVGYVFKSGGPITRVVIKPGKRIKVRGAGEELLHTLAVDPAPVRLELTIGGRRFCLEFGGESRFKANRTYLAKRAPAPGVCPAIGSPSGAFLSAPE